MDKKIDNSLISKKDYLKTSFISLGIFFLCLLLVPGFPSMIYQTVRAGTRSIPVYTMLMYAVLVLLTYRFKHKLALYYILPFIAPSAVYFIQGFLYSMAYSRPLFRDIGDFFFMLYVPPIFSAFIFMPAILLAVHSIRTKHITKIRGVIVALSVSLAVIISISTMIRNYNNFGDLVQRNRTSIFQELEDWYQEK